MMNYAFKLFHENLERNSIEVTSKYQNSLLLNKYYCSSNSIEFTSNNQNSLMLNKLRIIYLVSISS